MKDLHKTSKNNEKGENTNGNKRILLHYPLQ